MTPRNIFALVLILISFAVLYPGLTQDLITIEASANLLGNELKLFSQTRSILQTVEGLHESGNTFVAGLILLFSVVVPFVKGGLLLVALFVGSWATRDRLVRFVAAISKWAMADVFVVGVFVAYLAAKATQNMDARIESGFYWFTAYCLISLASAQFLKIEKPETTAEMAAANAVGRRAGVG